MIDRRDLQSSIRSKTGRTWPRGEPEQDLDTTGLQLAQAKPGWNRTARPKVAGSGSAPVRNAGRASASSCPTSGRIGYRSIPVLVQPGFGQEQNLAEPLGVRRGSSSVRSCTFCHGLQRYQACSVSRNLSPF